MLEAGERLVLDHLEKKNYLEQKKNDVHVVTRHSILLAVAIAGITVFVSWFAPPSRASLETTIAIFGIGLTSAMWFFIISTAGEIARLSARFYPAFSPVELETYQHGFVLTDRRLILKGLEFFRKKVHNLPGDLVHKQRDVISIERAALEAIEIEARFYTFKVNFRLKYRWKYSFQNGGQNIHSAKYNSDQIDAMVPGIIEFGKSSSPDVPFKHMESGDDGLFRILFVLLVLGIIIVLNLN
jgi:hypothetical protein